MPNQPGFRPRQADSLDGEVVVERESTAHDHAAFRAVSKCDFVARNAIAPKGHQNARREDASDLLDEARGMDHYDWIHYWFPFRFRRRSALLSYERLVARHRLFFANVRNKIQAILSSS